MKAIETFLLCTTLAFALQTPGCTTMFKTYDHSETPDGTSASSTPDGVVYYLPKKLLKVTLTRKPVAADSIKKAAKAAEDAKAALDSATKEEAQAKQAYGLSKKVLDSVNGSADASLIAAATAESTKRNAALIEKQVALADAKAKAVAAAENYQNAVIAEAATPELIAAVEPLRRLRLDVIDLEREISTLVKKQNPSEEEKTRLADKKVALAAAEAAFDDAEKFANAKFNEAALLTSSSGAKLFQDEISIADLPAVPDATRTYVTKLNHWWTREDHFALTTTPSGLLKTMTGETVDKTPQIIEDIAKLAIMAAGGLPVPSMGAMAVQVSPEDKGVPCPDVPNTSFPNEKAAVFRNVEAKAINQELIFDPANFEDVLKVNAELCRVGSRFLVAVVLPDDRGSLKSNDAVVFTKNDWFGDRQYADGLVYRRPLPYTVELRERVSISKKRVDNESPTAIRNMQEGISVVKKSAIYVLPNGGPISAISMEAGFFVETKFDVGFDDGMLTKSEVTRPSELKAFVELPLTIAKDVVAVPTEMLQLKVDYTSKDTELMKAQQENVEAAKALVEAVQAASQSSDSSAGTSQ